MRSNSDPPRSHTICADGTGRGLIFLMRAWAALVNPAVDC